MCPLDGLDLRQGWSISYLIILQTCDVFLLCFSGSIRWHLSSIVYMFCFVEQVTLNENDNEMSRRLIKVLEKLRSSDRAYYQLCRLVRQGEHPREGFLLLSNLFEDQLGANNGYTDWMIQISRQVQQT